MAPPTEGHDASRACRPRRGNAASAGNVTVMPIGLGSNASHQPTTLLPARPAAALQTELLYSSAAALQLLIEADQATWVLGSLVLANALRRALLQQPTATLSPCAAIAASRSLAGQQSLGRTEGAPKQHEEQPVADAASMHRRSSVAVPMPAASRPMHMFAAGAEAQAAPERVQHAAEQAGQSAAGGCCSQAVQPPASGAATGAANAGHDTSAPQRRRSNRIAARQGRQDVQLDAGMDVSDSPGPAHEAAPGALGAAPHSSAEPPLPPPHPLADAYSTAALRLAFAMSALLFMALLLPVVAPRASAHASKVLFAAVLGAMTVAVAAAPLLRKPAARLNPMFKAADWEASFLFHDSRARHLADAMASITACASCTIRLYRALLGDCSGSFAQAAPVVVSFAIQAVPLALICTRSLWYVRNREVVLVTARFCTAAIIAGWSTGVLQQCRSPNDSLNLTVAAALAVHRALSFQVRFDQHMLLVAAAEAPVQLLRLLGRQRFSGIELLAWMLALVAAPAAAVWQAERLARRQFAVAQRMGRPGVAPPMLPPDAFFRPPDLGAADSGAVLAKMAGARDSAYVQPPQLRLG